MCENGQNAEAVEAPPRLRYPVLLPILGYSILAGIFVEAMVVLALLDAIHGAPAAVWRVALALLPLVLLAWPFRVRLRKRWCERYECSWTRPPFRRTAGEVVCQSLLLLVCSVVTLPLILIPRIGSSFCFAGVFWGVAEAEFFILNRWANRVAADGDGALARSVVEGATGPNSDV